MDKPYTIVQGDTLSGISQRFYGDPKRFLEIFNYNRGKFVSDDPNLIYPGTEILIPLDDLTDRKCKFPVPPLPVGLNVFDQNEQVSILINEVQFYNWTTTNIQLNIDTAADGFQLTAIMNLDQAGQPPDDLSPFGYENCKVMIGEDVILTGRIDILNPKLESNSLTITISGRSKAGLIIDSSIPDRPFEYLNLNLEEIAKILLVRFNIKAEFPDGPGNKFEKANASHGETIFSFLNKLATQRGLLITSSCCGDLVFKRISLTKADAFIEEGDTNILSINPVYNGQVRYSDITVDGQKRKGEKVTQGKAIDSIVKEAGIERPLVIKAPETSEGLDLDDIAKWERGKRSAESMPLTVKVKGWRKPNLIPWRDGDFITVKSPSVYIVKDTTYVVKTVDFTLNTDEKTTILNCVLPSSYTLLDELARPWQL